MSRPLLLLGFLLAAMPLALLAFVTQPLVHPAGSPTPAADPDRLKADVKRLSVDYHPRRHDRFENLEAAAAHILSQFQRAGAATRIQEIPVEGRGHKNVIARFGPPAGPLTVIGAHYDSFGNTPGADDNASGVAGLLELARLMAASPPARPVELVAYTLEEPPYFRTPHMGSVRHAQELKASEQEVALMISLEMIGYFTDQPASQAYPLPGMKLLYPDRGHFIALVGQFGDFEAMRRAKALMSGGTSLPVHSINASTSLPGIDLSDHQSYWAEGFPAMMVTDTAFYRNPNYHRDEDRYETLDYRRMAAVVEGVLAIAREFGGDAAAPDRSRQ